MLGDPLPYLDQSGSPLSDKARSNVAHTSPGHADSLIVEGDDVSVSTAENPASLFTPASPRTEPAPFRGLVLSLFPGIGLLDMAFEEAGFCVVRGPDLLWGGDIKRFHPPAGRFDGIIGGPPCQLFSRMRHIQPLAGLKHGNLIPEFERCVRLANPLWFLMENVPDAPKPKPNSSYLTKSVMIRDVWVGGETSRMRRLTFGSRATVSGFNIDTLALHRTDPRPAALAGGARRAPVKMGGSGKVKASRRVCAGDSKTQEGYAAALEAQGLPPEFLADAPFTVAGKIKAVGNGVPIAMGRAVAAAVVKAISQVGRLPSPAPAYRPPASGVVSVQREVLGLHGPRLPLEHTDEKILEGSISNE